MISFGKQEYVSSLMEMWRLSFPNDPEKFVQFYFSDIYTNENTLVYLKNNKPAASLQILPYSIQIDKQIYQTGYISGAMTHPDYRGEGLMSQLLNQAFEVMKERKHTFSFLIPQEEWLQSYYARFGYQKSFLTKESISLTPQHHYEETRQNNLNIYTSFDHLDLDAFYVTYISFLKEKSHVVLKTKEQVQWILEDLFLGDGVLFTNNDGLAFTILQDQQVIVKEIFYDNKETQAAILDTIAKTYPEKEIILLNAGNNRSYYAGMVKSFNNIALPDDTYMSLMMD